MANLVLKNGIYIVRFRFQGKEYKRSLKTHDKSAAEAARNSVEVTIHRLVTGTYKLASGVDPGDFIVSGGTLTEQTTRYETPPPLPTTRSLIQDYLESQKNLLAKSYHYSQEIHLRHFTKYLGDLVDAPCDQIRQQHLERFLRGRLTIRDPSTVARERVTLIQFYKWVCAQESQASYSSPASKLFTIKFGRDRDPFRTLAEVRQIIERGGLMEEEKLDLWECVYLSPAEIGGLLETVRANATDPMSFMLHAIPAYTGMRRGEVLRLTWVDVDLDSGYITARSRKQSRTRTETIRRIDLHPELKAHLLEWRGQRPKGQIVICNAKTLQPITTDQANRLFWQPMRGTEWCLDSSRNWFKIGFHTYRHSFASNFAAAGVDQRVIDRWMGHMTEAMRRRYQHLFPRALSEGIRRLSFQTDVLSGVP